MGNEMMVCHYCGYLNIMAAQNVSEITAIINSQLKLNFH